jgi:ketosteroid isomerase-like protein
VRHWDDATDRDADQLYRTFTEAKIRRYQDLARQQIATAYRQHNDDALADLRCMENALGREMLRRAQRSIDYITRELADVMAAGNTRFDRERFCKAAGMEEGQS